jgi:transposase-like protein
MRINVRGDPMTYIDILKRFPTEKSYLENYIMVRYPNGIRCSHCGSVKVYQRNTNYKVVDCNDCGKTFSLLKDTIFEHSSTDLRKWFYACYLVLASNNDLSSLQLQREIGVTYKCAWRMIQLIHYAMYNVTQREFLNTIKTSLRYINLELKSAPRLGQRIAAL